MRFLLLTIIVFLSSAASAQTPTAEQLREEGLRLFEQAGAATEYAIAEETVKAGIRRLQEAAALNDAQAQYILGTLVLTHSVPPEFDIDPMDMFLSAAKQGHEEALYGICALLFQGAELSTADEEWLLEQLEKRAAAGVQEAASVLAPLYFVFGRSAQFDAAMAELTQKAEAGEAHAQYLLGTILIDPAGLGFPKDIAKGLAYLEQAAAAKYMLAQLFLGEIYLHHDEIKNIDKALMYMEGAAESGDPVNEARVGILYYELGRSDEDYKNAFKWLSRAAEKNVREAQFYLANLYKQGKGVPMDQEKAEALFEESQKP